MHLRLHLCARACACVRARARACACVCVCVQAAAVNVHYLVAGGTLDELMWASLARQMPATTPPQTHTS